MKETESLFDLTEESFARRLARRFHDLHEDAAPMFGYETRPGTRVTYEDLPEPNRYLMEYVCSMIELELLAHLERSLKAEIERQKAAQHGE